MVPYISHFVIEGSPVIPLFCEATNPVCVSWGSEKNFLCKESWTMEGIDGCCWEKIITPATKCSDKIELIVFIVFSIILSAIYFLLGSLISWKLISKNK